MSVEDKSHLTDEVGDEGGTPGNLEERDSETGRGSEAGETWQPAEQDEEDVLRDETPPGRRSP